MRTPHTSCRQGKHVIVVLKDGTRIEDVFVERTGNFVILRDAGRVRAGTIRSFRLARGKK